MTVTPGEQTPAARRRGQGQRAGLTRERVLAAARHIPPERLTMQAVANALGVDRKAVHHHVPDREQLLELIAQDAFSSGFADAEISLDGEWRAACRNYALGFAHSLIEMGGLAEYFRPTRAVLESLLPPSERVLKTLLAAGFDDETAGRTLHLLSTLSVGHARSVRFASQSGEHPSLPELRDLVASTVDPVPETLARFLAAPVVLADDAQLGFSIEVVLLGAEALRLARSGAVTPPG